MKRTAEILTFLVAVVTTSCTQTTGKAPPAPKQSETAAIQVEKARSESVDAAKTVTDYAYAQKAVFVDKMKRELVTIQEELDRLSTKIDKAGGATKADAKTRLATVREQWVRVKKQLDQAEGATESTWDDVKGGFKNAYSDLQDSVTTTRQWLSDKIAP
jgi:chromosome segregation ATPase